MKDRSETFRPSDAQRADRLYRAVDELDRPAELAKQVYYLGRPRFTDSIPTASLVMAADAEALFRFNRAFFDRLGPRELVFVLLHEALHYAFCHHLRRQERLPDVWNVACDLVVNEFLLECVGFRDVSDGAFRAFVRSAITFENVPVAPGEDHLALTAEQVYDRLMRNGWPVSGPGGNVTACDEHAWPQGGCDADGGALAEQIEDFVDDVRRAFRRHSPTWGDEAVGELQAVGETLEPLRLNWSTILSCRIASCIKLAYEQRWAPPGRKIAWLYPSVLLPAEQEIEKFHASVLLAVDASGSITSRDALDRLVRMARSIPRDRVEVTAVSFDTGVYPLDIWQTPPRVRGGGGTSFQAVEQWATQLPRYPDLIVVLTDGEAPRPSVQHPHRWFWLITEHGTSDRVDGVGRWCRIEDVTANSPGR